MTTVLIDSSAWIEYFFGTTKGLKVREIILNQNNELFTPKIVISEVTSKLDRFNFDSKKAFDAITSLSLMPKEDEQTYFNAGKIHSKKFNKNKMSMADAIILSISKTNNCKILSFDKHLESNSIKI